MRKMLLVGLLAFLASATSASAISISGISHPMPAGGWEVVLQVTGAYEGPTAGGPAVSTTQTMYYFTPDTTAVPSYAGGAWGYIFIDPADVSGINVSVPAITASFSAGAPQEINGVGSLVASPLLVNGSPVYFFKFGGEQGNPYSVAGIYPGWEGVLQDGTAIDHLTMGSLPEPSTAMLMGIGMLSLGAFGRRQRS